MRNAPEFIEPMAATSVRELPHGPEWSFEIKLDGYRVIAVKSGTRSDCSRAGTRI